MQYDFVKWQSFKGDFATRNKPIVEQDGRLHANLSVLRRICCNRESHQGIKPVCSTRIDVPEKLQKHWRDSKTTPGVVMCLSLLLCILLQMTLASIKSLDDQALRSWFQDNRERISLDFLLWLSERSKPFIPMSSSQSNKHVFWTCMTLHNCMHAVTIAKPLYHVLIHLKLILNVKSKQDPSILDQWGQHTISSYYTFIPIESHCTAGNIENTQT